MTFAQAQRIGMILGDEESGTFVGMDVRNEADDSNAVRVTVTEVDDDGMERTNVIVIQTDGTVSDAYEEH